MNEIAASNQRSVRKASSRLRMLKPVRTGKLPKILKGPVRKTGKEK